MVGALLGQVSWSNWVVARRGQRTHDRDENALVTRHAKSNSKVTAISRVLATHHDDQRHPPLLLSCFLTFELETPEVFLLLSSVTLTL